MRTSLLEVKLSLTLSQGEEFIVWKLSILRTYSLNLCHRLPFTIELVAHLIRNLQLCDLINRRIMLVITAIISCLTINSIVRSAVHTFSSQQWNRWFRDCTVVFVGRIPREGSTLQWRCRRQTATGRGRVGCCHGYACRTPQPPRACVCPWVRLWKCSSCVIGSLGHGALWSFHSIKYAACLSWWFHVSAECLRAIILYWIQYSIIFV